MTYILPHGTDHHSSGGLPAHIADNGKPLCGAEVGEYTVSQVLQAWNLCEACGSKEPIRAEIGQLGLFD